MSSGTASGENCPSRVDARRAGALRQSLLEGALHAVMVGVAESYFGAFAVELGHAGSQLALLATLPVFLGACAQLGSPAAARVLRARKRLVVVGATLQALTLAAFALIAWRAEPGLGWLLLAKCAFWVSASVIVPAWNAWMGDLTEGAERARYFARRSAATHAALLVAFGLAGMALQSAGAALLDCYATLFCVALVARLASVVCFVRQFDPAAPLSPEARGRQRFRLRLMLARSDFKVARYLALLALGTQAAAPFFTPFMLRELRLDYATFAALAALSILAKAVTFRACNSLARLLGLRLLLVISGFAVAMIPVVWMTSTQLSTLVFVHLLGGAAWAGVEYASFQLQLASCRPRVAAEFFAVSNALVGAASITGALAGGYLLSRGQLDFRHVFLASAILRAAPLVALLLAFRETDFPRELAEVYARILSVRPGAGASQRPILVPPANDEEAADDADAEVRRGADVSGAEGSANRGAEKRGVWRRWRGMSRASE